MAAQNASGQYAADPARGAYSRRRFLARVGAGTAGAIAAGPVCAMAGSAGAAHAAAAARADRFGRIFTGLPAFLTAVNDRERAALTDIGKHGGLLDARDNLAAGPILLITDPALSANNQDNPTQTAGVTFLGQFLDHDMTFDPVSPLGVPTAPEQSPNARTPALDLDTVYGGGPATHPALYEADRIHLRIESGGLFEDLPRGTDGRAIIADPRNDENLIIAGLHAAFILFHNRVVDRLAGDGVPVAQRFDRARQLVTWHYQWIIVHEFLPQIIGTAATQDIFRNGRRWYRPDPGPAYIPVEFQGAAYRFGHSQVRPSYRANLAGNPDGSPFFGFIFDPAGEGQADPVDLRGGRRAPRRFIGWQTFFDFGDGNVRTNKRIDRRISTPLFRLPLSTIPSGDAPISLPQRNLLRQVTWSLPAGQRIAQTMGVEMLHLQELASYGVALENQTPLWYYVLAEAERLASGLHLGPVGGRIVGEVFAGLLELDPRSYLSVQPGWTPTLPSASPGRFHMTDLLRFARVDPASRGQ
ncbi:peroxidase family protein [Jidongwangia harbinensis]|uniref:peroxidase family protein n=1 Tax=Jidongwangia harbinensis TaxID=2878561 RepID=UPI001CD93D76|nr:heme peroxidase family protein [Jidongwangia harbinensis]MCA2212903.1 heme peroxidase family protein [Jidongwangia harbinensis]